FHLMSEEQQPVAERLSSLMQQPEDAISLAEAALLIASCEYPTLKSSAYIERLDRMADAVQRRAAQETDPFRTIGAMNEHLFEEQGFSGNSDDYYDPRNSFLNDVLDRKTGIPIMLSTVYLEVAQRLQFPLVGVGMPGHFLVKHPYFNILIDPFSGGRVVSEA